MQKLISLDLGTSRIKGMLFDTQSRLELIKSVQEPVTPHAPQEPVEGQEPTELEVVPDWASALERLVEHFDLMGDETIVATMPDGMAMTIQLQELPFTDPSKLAQILPSLLIERIPLDLDDITYDFRVMQRPNQDPEAVVGFARNDALIDTLAWMEVAGVNPRALMLPEWVLEFCAHAFLPQTEGTFALMDMGHTYTRILVMQDGLPVMARALKRGGHNMTQALAEVFNIPTEDAERVKTQRGAIYTPNEVSDPSYGAMSDAITGALSPVVRDLRRTLKALYAQQRVQIERVYVCGGSAQIKNMTRFLSQELGLPVEALNLNVVANQQSNITAAQLSEFVLCYGMAYAQTMGRQDLKVLNLRRGAFEYRGRSRFVRKRAIQYGVAAALVLALFAVALVAQHYELSAQRDAMDAAVRKETKALFGKAYTKKKSVIRELSEAAPEDANIVPKMSAYQLMYEVISTISQNNKLKLSRIEVDASRNLIQVFGATDNAQSVDKIVAELDEGLECLENIRRENLKVRSETEATFELQISSKCS